MIRSRLRFSQIVITLVVVLAGTSALTRAQTRIMCLGDSITNGGNAYASYRYELWFDLQSAGYSVDFVGGRDFLFNGDPNFTWYPDYNTTFDRDHEGYWGWRTDEIAAIVLNITTNAQPDVVMIHLGTNDIGQMGASGVTNADTHLRSIINSIRSVRPDVTILLARIIPIGPGSGYFPNAGQVGPLNAIITTIAADMDTPGSPILLIDQNAGFDLNTMVQPDGLHPNLLGEARLADVWFSTLDTLPILMNPPPSVSITSPIDGAVFTEPADITITASATDSNGSVTQVSFYNGAALLGTDTTAPYAYDWTAVPIGSYTLTAVATDDGSATQTSTPVQVQVAPSGGTIPISISNPSFETPVLPDGVLAGGPGVIGDWTFTATANTFLGIFNPPAGSYPSAGGNGTPAGADGINAAYLFNNGGPADSVAATQILSETLAMDTEYTLTVAIGNFLPDQPFTFSTYGGYVIELLAGSTVIASDSDTITPGVGQFADATVSVVSNNLDPALLGEALSIRLTLSATDAPRSTHFDYVRLTRRDLSGVGIPALSSWGILVMVLLILSAGTLVFGRRVRVATP